MAILSANFFKSLISVLHYIPFTKIKYFTITALFLQYFLSNKGFEYTSFLHLSSNTIKNYIHSLNSVLI